MECGEMFGREGLRLTAQVLPQTVSGRIGSGGSGASVRYRQSAIVRGLHQPLSAEESGNV